MGKKKTKKLYALRDGERHEVTGQDGRYWKCGERRFRKAVTEIAEAAEADTAQETAEEPEE